MKYFKLFGIVCLWLVLSSPAHSVMIGDKDWMQFTETSGYSWNDFDEIFDSASGKCESGSCLLGGVIDVTGYNWASTTEALQLIAEVTGITSNPHANNNTTDYLGINVGELFYEKFTPLLSDPDLSQYAVGWTRDSHLSGKGDAVYVYNNMGGNAHLSDYVYHQVNFNRSLSTQSFGGYLYKTVPEPATLLLLCAGLGCLVKIRQTYSQTVG